MKIIASTSPRKQSNKVRKTKSNLNSSLLFINFLLKSIDLSKQDSSKCSSHRAITFRKSVRFILFFHILAIFPLLGKLEKGQVGISILCVMTTVSYTSRNHTAALEWNIKSRAVIGKLLFFSNIMIMQITIKLHFIKIWRFPGIIKG